MQPPSLEERMQEVWSRVNELEDCVVEEQMKTREHWEKMKETEKLIRTHLVMIQQILEGLKINGQVLVPRPATQQLPVEPPWPGNHTEAGLPAAHAGAPTPRG